MVSTPTHTIVTIVTRAIQFTCLAFRPAALPVHLLSCGGEYAPSNLLALRFVPRPCQSICFLVGKIAMDLAQQTFGVVVNGQLWQPYKRWSQLSSQTKHGHALASVRSSSPCIALASTARRLPTGRTWPRPAAALIDQHWHDIVFYWPLSTRPTHLCISLVPHLLVLATLDEHPSHSLVHLTRASPARVGHP
jgi:hypothetical protein